MVMRRPRIKGLDLTFGRSATADRMDAPFRTRSPPWSTNPTFSVDCRRLGAPEGQHESVLVAHGPACKQLTSKVAYILREEENGWPNWPS
jgi:hypothetical protein